jgi:hypothetical protein
MSQEKLGKVNVQQMMTCSIELTTVKMFAIVTDAEWWPAYIDNIWSAKLRL